MKILFLIDRLLSLRQKQECVALIWANTSASNRYRNIEDNELVY